MHLDPAFQEFSLVLLFLFLIGGISKYLKLPSAIGFLIAGVLIGPNLLGIVSQDSSIGTIGSAGVVLLLFFVGVELSPKDLIRDWKINLVGTIAQILFSVGVVLALGHYLDWPIARIVLLGFVISLSSTSMVIQLIQDKNLTKTRLGKDALGILITQDILIVPMLIILGLLEGGKVDFTQFAKQTFGGVVLISLFLLSPKLEKLKDSIREKLKRDHDLSLLFCLAFAFSLALFSGYFELSTALGAFVAGNIVGQLDLDDIFHESLHSFKTVLLALFFSSIGILLDLEFLLNHFPTIASLTFLALLTNTLLNAFILKGLGRSWREAFLTSSYLAQIGEFSFLLAAIGFKQNIVSSFGYQLTMYMIFFSIVLTPIWVKLFTILSAEKKTRLA